MKKAAIIFFLLFAKTSYGQTLKDTINYLKDYSHAYLELLFNKRDIDSAMHFWSEGMFKGLKFDYSQYKRTCDTNSTLKVLFTEDMNSFYNRVTGKIDFYATDDKEGINIVYLPAPGQDYLFLINYDFWGEFESHNRLMRTSLSFESGDKGKTWMLTQDSWINNYMYLNYFRKDYFGGKPSN